MGNALGYKINKINRVCCFRSCSWQNNLAHVFLSAVCSSEKAAFVDRAESCIVGNCAAYIGERRTTTKIFDFLFHTDYYDIWILREAAIPAGFHSNLIPCRKNVISKRIGILYLPEPTEAPWCSWWCMSTWYYKYTGWVKSFVWESSLKSTSNIKSLRQLFFFYQNFYKTKKEARLKNICIKKGLQASETLNKRKGKIILLLYCL